MVVSGPGEVGKTLGVDIALLSFFRFPIIHPSVCLSVCICLSFFFPSAITAKWLTVLTTFLPQYLCSSSSMEGGGGAC